MTKTADKVLAGAIAAGFLVFVIIPHYKKANDADRAAELHRKLARGETLSVEDSEWLARYDATVPSGWERSF